MAKYLAVVGCGPKGAAIAAKAAALQDAGYAVPAIVIFEPNAPASAWSGRYGYTDGEQPLCTLAERDLGYPYDRVSFPARSPRLGVPELMFAQYSWHQFAITAGIGEAMYDRWVIRGRRPPTHIDFGRYIEAAVAAAVKRGCVTVEPLAITHIEYHDTRDRWTVDTTNGRYPTRFDGVVVTGSGEPYEKLKNANDRVFDGKTFWQQLPRMKTLLQSEPEANRSVAIIGAGGTGASVAQWFVRNGFSKMPIHIIGYEPTLYSRSPSFFEDRLFSDTRAWERLAPHTQDAFVARLTRGVVWSDVVQNLMDAKLQYGSFEAREFEVIPTPHPPGTPEYLNLVLDYPPEPGRRRPTVLPTPAEKLDVTVYVDARGFDLWWFVDKLLAPGGPIHTHFLNKKDYILKTIDDFLSVGGLISLSHRFPKGFHVPMLASRQGPAAANLMALGWMSDRILLRYVTI